MIGPAYLLDGKIDRARTYYDQWASNWGTGTELQVASLFDALAGRGDRQAFARALAATPSRSWNDPESGYLMTDFDIPMLLVLLNEKELALQYLHDATESGNLAWGMLLPVNDPIRCDARFRKRVADMKLRDLRAEKLCT
jgi:hypothetical protein